MKIQNKYIFRTIISEFMGLTWLRDPGTWIIPDPDAWVWRSNA